jgi:predicted phosphodiesterase
MRVFALSDLHIDYDANAAWVRDLSATEYRDDALILAGDLSHTSRLLAWGLGILTQRFKKVLFVPGNHDLWIVRDCREKDSLQKFEDVRAIVQNSGATMRPFQERGISVIPLLAWYDYSFGEPSEELKSMWADYSACRWPNGLKEGDVAAHFAALNERHHGVDAKFASSGHADETVITYSHFLPRIDLMPTFIPAARRVVYPVLGSAQIETQLRRYNPSIHIYGHSHVNRRVQLDGIVYINNAFGYPSETRTTAKQLLCIHEC